MPAARILRPALLVFVTAHCMAAASPVLAGRIVDDSGAPVANARVVARSGPDAAPQETSSNAAGAFELVYDNAYALAA